tara:strand:+ start:696 stop:1718 length:1023 start_codon:yes stop_codon:yes gene_type:complete
MKPLLTALRLFALVVIAVPGSSQADNKKNPESRDKAKPEANAPDSQIKQPGAKPDPRPRPQAKPRPVPEKTKAPEDPERTWLGIATSGVAPSLRQHLDLEKGFGIQIQEVITDSPAGKSGLKSHDILVKFEDQLLISPEHLSLLVRREKSGKKISLSVIRKGREETIQATLGSAALPPTHRPGPPSAGHHPQNWQETMMRQQDYWNNWMEKNMGKVKREHSDGRPPSLSLRPGFPVNIFGAGGVLKIDNEKGDVTVTLKDGEHLIEIRDEDKKLIHKGEFDIRKGIEGLPAKAREQLKDMKLDDLKAFSFSLEKSTPKGNSSTDKKKGSAVRKEAPDDLP